MKQCISKSSHPSTTCIFKQKKEERSSTIKGDSFFPHRITSDTHLPWAAKEGVPWLIHSAAWQPLQDSAGVMVLVKAGIQAMP